VSNKSKPPVDQSGTPTIEAVHRDVGFANEYRLEVIKTMLAISTALLAFTVSFRPKLNPVWYEWMMVAGWVGLGASLIGGILTMYCWELYYISYRDYDHKGRAVAGREYRDKVNKCRKAAFLVQCVGFLIGVAGVAMFAGVNVSNVDDESINSEARETRNAD